MAAVLRTILCVFLLQFSDVRSMRISRRNSSGQEATATAAQELPTKPAADNDGCSVPSWVIDAVKGVINSGLQDKLGEMDPWDYNIRNTLYELPLFACTLKVNASTDLQVAGLSHARVSDLQCLQSTCLEEGWMCKKYEHSLRATLELGVLPVNGTDWSQWECGLQFPKREMSLSYELHDYGIQAEFKLNQTMFPPSGNVTEITSVQTQLGEPKSHKCTVQGIEFGSVCGPQLQLIARIMQDAVKDVIDPIMLALLNTLLKPEE